MSGGVAQILALAAEVTSGEGSTAAETAPPVPPEAEVAAAEREGSDEAIRTQAMQVRVHASNAPRIAIGRQEAHAERPVYSVACWSCLVRPPLSVFPPVCTLPAGFHVASLPVSQLERTAPNKPRAIGTPILVCERKRRTQEV